MPKGILVTGHYKDEHRIPFFVEPGDSLHVVVTFAEVPEADSAAAEEPHSLHSAAAEAPPAYSLTLDSLEVIESLRQDLNHRTHGIYQ